MKKAYESPQMCWQPIRSSRAVAEVCWGHASSVKPFYYNTKGTGYAELYADGKCKSGQITFRVEFYPDTMSQQDRIAAQQEIDSVIARVIAELGNKNPSPYKNSVFSPSVGSDWS